MNTYQAYEIGEGYNIGSLRLNKRAMPDLEAHQILVQMKAFSLNYRDLLVVKGQGSWKPPLGRIPLSDGVGEVVALGSGVERLKVGERIAGLFLPHWIEGKIAPEKLRQSLGGAASDGVLAQYVVFSQEAVIPVPAHLTDEEAATLPCAALTAWHALIEEGKATAGERVLIQGTGGVSLFALQFALLSGLEVFLLSGSQEKLDKARQWGVEHLINYRQQPDWADEILRRTGGVGVEHVIEVVGGDNLSKSTAAVRTGGSIYTIGFLNGFMSEVSIQQLMGKQIRLQGIEVGSKAMFTRMNQAISARQMRPVIDEVFGFGEVDMALRKLEEGKQFGKICIKMN